LKWLRETIDRIEGTYPTTHYKADKSFIDISTYRDGYRADSCDIIHSITLCLPEQKTLTKELETLQSLGPDYKIDHLRINTPNLGLKLQNGHRKILDYRLRELQRNSIYETCGLELLCKILEVSTEEFLPNLQEKSKEVSEKITSKKSYPPTFLPTFLEEKDFTISFKVDKDQDLADINVTKRKPNTTALDLIRLVEDAYGDVPVKSLHNYRRGRYFYSQFADNTNILDSDREVEKPIYISIHGKTWKSSIPNITHDWVSVTGDVFSAVVSPRPKMRLNINLYKEEAKELEKIISTFEENS
jgi:hypothetical protein